MPPFHCFCRRPCAPLFTIIYPLLGSWALSSSYTTIYVILDRPLVAIVAVLMGYP